ncbi:MAG: hypothetical protein WC238_06125 [Parcubacteria group bacterium]|jgi:hypothetical protein
MGVGEEETIFSSKVKYNGIFSFKDFYKFCYDWMTEEYGWNVGEGKYAEKLSGETKDIEVEWSFSKKVTDYFKFKGKVSFKVNGLVSMEIMQGGAKVKTNKGSIEISIKGSLQRDYQGKFDTTAYRKFLRSIYEKWVIPARIDEYEGKIASQCDTFLGQAKAYLDLEGRK